MSKETEIINGVLKSVDKFLADLGATKGVKTYCKSYVYDGTNTEEQEEFDFVNDENIQQSTKVDFEAHETVGLCDGFIEYVKKLRALFGADPDVTVLGDDKHYVINICVAGCDKPDAYRIFFPGEIHLEGYPTVKVLVNGHKKSYKTTITEGVVRAVFMYHPLVKEIKVTTFSDGSPSRLFVIFRNSTVQYVNDNFGSLYNATTTVAEELARNIITNDYNCTINFMTESDYLPTAVNKGEFGK